MIDYIAIRNWAEPWDEGFTITFCISVSDGKWLLIPQDKDREWGEALGWQGSVVLLGRGKETASKPAGKMRLSKVFPETRLRGVFWNWMPRAF